MSIPSTERVIFKRNPLKQVICQIRFPAILRIDTALPADFQDEIRSEFPILRQRTENIRLPPELTRILPAEFNPGGDKIYDFVSADEKWVVSLSKDFLSLTSRDYWKWEGFKGYLSGPLNALVKYYKPAFYKRIGLRYQNIIKRSDLGLDAVGWNLLLKPHIAGILSSDTNLAEETVLESHHNELIRLDESGSRVVRMKYGLIREKDSQEADFLIDNDFFTRERVEVDNAESELGYFNEHSGQFFQWCITERLRNAMEPTNI